MPESHSDLVRRGYEAWNSGDRSWVLNHMAEDANWHPNPNDPERSTYRGRDQIERFWREWREAVGQVHFEPIEMIERDGHVAVVLRRSATGITSGLEVSDEVAQVFLFGPDDRVHTVHELNERAEAIAVLDEVEGEGGDG